MQLKPENEITDLLSHATSGLTKERKLDLLAHARNAESHGKLEEFHGIVTSDSSLKKAEVSFVTSIIDGKPAAGAEEPVQASTTDTTPRAATSK